MREPNSAYPHQLAVWVFPRKLGQARRVLTERSRAAYLRPMRSKPLELPPNVARRFLADMRAFFRRNERQ